MARTGDRSGVDVANRPGADRFRLRAALGTDEGPLARELLGQPLPEPVLVLLNFAAPLDIAPWQDSVRLIDARYDGTWELPAIGTVAAPAAVLIRPDGYVAWVGAPADRGLPDALTSWFGPSCHEPGSPR